MTPLARVAVVLPAVNYLVNLIVQRVDADQWRTTGHELRVAWDDAQHQVPAPPVHTATLTPVASVVGVVTIAAIVFACIWQHRAASAARALGYPAARSPGWGVGCWFVPIVNLWMPYGAVRDCLPPGHPERRASSGGGWRGCARRTSASSRRCSPSSPPERGLAVSIPAALAALAVIAWAPGIVTTIGMAHRDAVGPLGTDLRPFPGHGPLRGGNPAKTAKARRSW